MATQTTVNAQKGCDHEAADLGFQALTVNRRLVTDANQTATIADFIIAFPALAASRTLNLPAAATAAGKVLIVKDEGGTAVSGNITLDPSGAELIDGAATKSISTAYGVLRVYCTGTAWFSF